MKSSLFSIHNFDSPARCTGHASLCLIAPLLTIMLLVSAVSCSKRGASTKPADVDYYTCTMHPSVKTVDPKAHCPICSMNLVPVKKKASPTGVPGVGEKGHDHAKMLAEQAATKKSAPASAHEDHGAHAGHGQSVPAGRISDETPAEFVVPVARQQQIGVTYATVENKSLRHALRAVGLVAYDKLRHWDYVSRVEGYVQKLHVGSRGEVVEKDQPLLTIYSPDLLTTQREFVDLLRLRDEARKSGLQPAIESADRLLESAKRRLSLWNIADPQIAELETSRTPKETLTLYSPFKGVVRDIPVDQGKRVVTGDQLVDVADLSVAWVWAEFYQDELPMLKSGLPAVITTSSYPGEKFGGRIAVMDPFIDEAKRTGRVRLDVENSDFKLRPEMFVDVEMEMDMGQGLTIPVSAVMPTGKRNVVFVDKGEGKLEPRFVELSGKFGGDYAVKSGLAEGERLVNSANFLIDAEAKVQGALRSW